MQDYIGKIFLFIFLLAVLPECSRAAPQDNMFERINKSIYQLYAIDQDKQTVVALGNAVAVTPHYLATNCHVALSGNFLILRVNETPYLARLCYFNQTDDLCIIDVVGVDLVPVKIRPSKLVKVGETVYAVAELKGQGAVTTKGEVSKIIIAGDHVVLQTTAMMRYGASGGGLFDKDGNLIGLISRGVPGTQTGFAISTELITSVILPENHPSCMIPESKPA